MLPLITPNDLFQKKSAEPQVSEWNRKRAMFSILKAWSFREI